LDKLVDNTTPRRTLFVAGLVLIGLGIGGFVFGWSNSDPIALPLTKRILFIVAGLLLEWIAEIWTSEWKRIVSATLGAAFTALGIAALIAKDLGFMHTGGSWEGVLYLALALPQFVALWWPRRFYDYEWGTGWSSGLRFASRPDSYQDGRPDLR
jgi:hypothetical protein